MTYLHLPMNHPLIALLNLLLVAIHAFIYWNC